MKNKINLSKVLNAQSENQKDGKIAVLSRRIHLEILAVFCLALIPLNCAKVPDFVKDTFQPEMIVPVFDPDAAYHAADGHCRLCQKRRKSNGSATQRCEGS